jgi:cytochrome c-type biogenesis protein CcmH/NrfG
LLDQGRFAEAATEFQASLKVRPDDEKALSGLEKALAGKAPSRSPQTLEDNTILDRQRDQ